MYPKFLETRAWVICNNFNQRSTRFLGAPQRSKSRNIIHRQAWNQTSRRIYRYFFYRTNEASGQPKSSGVPSPWALRIQGLIRELRRRGSDGRQLWQRRIFQILEVWSYNPRPRQPAANAAWQICSGILTAANHWRRRSRNVLKGIPTWTNVLWRVAWLNRRTAISKDRPDWQVRYRIIVSTSFRNRALGWNRTYHRILQVL
ncbi:hypothetical protein Turpa_3545 [Turneriella parva DSM 21527]|uniref:Uncharacterized protein n=1 Tax=Turneriella parva (strain ATCC BAA-1111 / DSM 21527 / NCTC 11395 / H) TaxID=869212 RepID=I4BA73_TURPD|nr:hypothetical protein Turpa_3545 [Turneriella parva DSM 21527]